MPGFADVTKSIDAKIDAIRCHSSQLTKFDLESSRDLARAMGRISGYEWMSANVIASFSSLRR